jgi:hypothetical protein
VLEHFSAVWHLRHHLHSYLPQALVFVLSINTSTGRESHDASWVSEICGQRMKKN